MAKVVINTCEKVLDGTASDLAEFKRTFTVSSGTSVHSEGSERLGGGPSQTLGTAIPTKSFTDLVCFADIKLLPSTVYEKSSGKRRLQRGAERFDRQAGFSKGYCGTSEGKDLGNKDSKGDAPERAREEVRRLERPNGALLSLNVLKLK